MGDLNDDQSTDTAAWADASPIHGNSGRRRADCRSLLGHPPGKYLLNYPLTKYFKHLVAGTAQFI